MTLRDELQPVVDESRQLVADLGFRVYAVTVRVRTWDGGEIGRGETDDADTVLSPPPKVASPSPRLVFAAPGKYEDGDRIVSRISRSYTEDELTGGAPDVDQEVCWLIDDDEYVLVGQPEKRPLEWRAHLRRRTRP